MMCAAKECAAAGASFSNLRLAIENDSGWVPVKTDQIDLPGTASTGEGETFGLDMLCLLILGSIFSMWK